MNEAQLQAAYTSATGQPAGRVERPPGGAGNRIYWRVHGLTGANAIVMELPAGPVESEEASKDHAAPEVPLATGHRYRQRSGPRGALGLPDAASAGLL